MNISRARDLCRRRFSHVVSLHIFSIFYSCSMPNERAVAREILFAQTILSFITKPIASHHRDKLFQQRAIPSLPTLTRNHISTASVKYNKINEICAITMYNTIFIVIPFLLFLLFILSLSLDDAYVFTLMHNQPSLPFVVNDERCSISYVRITTTYYSLPKRR